MQPDRGAARRRTVPLTDMPTGLMLVLVGIGLPRTILADLDVVAPESGLFYYFLALAPFAAWLGVAIGRPTRKPIMDFLALGVLYGLSLVVVHQILWDVAPPVDHGRGTSIGIAMVIGIGAGAVAAVAAVIARGLRCRAWAKPRQ